MLMKYFKPITPGTRNKVIVGFGQISKVKPEKSLTKGKSRISGRDGQGRISVRRKGGGHKKKYRIIDFKRNKFDIPALVKTIEYDPNRSAFIALVAYKDGEKRYILASSNLQIGQTIISTSSKEIKNQEGNSMPLKFINVGNFVHNVELNPGKGGQIVRSAGSFAKLLGRDNEYVILQFPSGEVRKVLGKCYATIGVVSNKERKNESSGKAGRSRWLGKRPKVRGVVMNPVDHPMGGGEGKTSGGRHPCSPTGQPSKGLKTRKLKKYSTKFIVRRRKSK